MILGGVYKKQVTTYIPDKKTFKGCALLDGKPVRRRIVIFNRGSLEYIASSVTDVYGIWQCKGLPASISADVVVLQFDDSKQNNAQIFDYVTAAQET